MTFDVTNFGTPLSGQLVWRNAEKNFTESTSNGSFLKKVLRMLAESQQRHFDLLADGFGSLMQ